MIYAIWMFWFHSGFDNRTEARDTSSKIGRNAQYKGCATAGIIACSNAPFMQFGNRRLMRLAADLKSGVPELSRLLPKFRLEWAPQSEG
jgi:hypothetical protein